MEEESDAIVSSEFQYIVNDIERDSVIVAISQSGETANVLEVVKKAKTTGSKINLYSECSDFVLGTFE